MTGEAEPVSHDPARAKASRRAVRLATLSLAGAGAIVGILLIARTGGPPRTAVQPAKALESSLTLTESARSDARAEPAPAPTDAIGTPSATAQPSLPPSPLPGAPRRVEAATRGARPHGAPAGVAPPNAAPIASAQAPRAAPPKPPRDDGRDELYIPEAR